MSSDFVPGLLERTCIRCGELLALKRQKNTRFHNQTCKQAWHYARKATRDSENLAFAEQQFRHCRHRAHWYRLAILIKQTVWSYPPVGQPSVRFDRQVRATPGFLVDPYEPPVVPLKGRYSVFLFDVDAQPVASVAGCQVVRVEPIWQIGIESGDRRSDL